MRLLCARYGRTYNFLIELVWIDSQSDPAKATGAYAEAVESKGVQAAMLNWHSSVAAAVMDVAAQYKVQHVFGMGAAEIVNENYKSDPEKYSYWAAKGWPIPGDLIPGYAASSFWEKFYPFDILKIRVLCPYGTIKASGCS